MDDALLKNLIYISQVCLFGGIAMLIFAWVEKKSWIEKAGQLMFVVMGFFAAWIIMSGQLVIPETETKSVTKEMQTMFYLFGLIVASLFGLAAYILRLMKSKVASWLNFILVLIALVLFFLVYELIRA